MTTASPIGMLRCLMPHLFSGARLERLPDPKYAEALEFAEIALDARGPRPALLSRWRDQMPASFVCASVAPEDALVSPRGPLRRTDALEGARNRWVEGAKALRARVLIVPTDSQVTTGKRDQDLLTEYLAKINAPKGARVAWAPSGLWTLPDASRFAKKVGVLLAADPFDPFWNETGEIVYCRLEAHGVRQNLSDTLLAELLARLRSASTGEAFLSMASATAFRQAVRLRQMADAGP